MFCTNQLSKTNNNNSLHLSICNAETKEQRTFFCTKKSQKSLIHKITTIGSSVLTAMKITPIIAQSAATNLKNVTRGSFFDQESLKLFLDTQYQKEWTKKKLQIFELNDTLGVPGLISMVA